MGNFRQIRGLYRTAQLVLTEMDDYDPSYCRDMRRNHSSCSAAVGMAAASLLSGVLLLLFPVTMAAALGIKTPLDFSVFSASGGAFVLAGCTKYPFSIDRLRRDSSRQALPRWTSRRRIRS